MRLETAEYLVSEARKFVAVTDDPPDSVVAIAESTLIPIGEEAPSRTDGDPERTEDAGESAAEHGKERAPQPEHQSGDELTAGESVQEPPAPVSESPALTESPERPARPRGGSSGDVPDTRPPAASVIANEKLPIPSQIEGEPHEMPLDITSADDRLIRRLHGEYGAFVARTTWLLAQAGSDFSNAVHLAAEARRDALRKVSKIDDETGKAKLAMHIQAELDDDPEVKKWASKVQSHERDMEELKALKEIYSGYVTRLSREMSMRNDEFSRGGR